MAEGALAAVEMVAGRTELREYPMPAIANDAAPLEVGVARHGRRRRTPD